MKGHVREGETGAAAPIGFRQWVHSTSILRPNILSFMFHVTIHSNLWLIFRIALVIKIYYNDPDV